MPNVLNTLYPPTISTFLPAFVNTTDVFIYSLFLPIIHLLRFKEFMFL